MNNKSFSVTLKEHLQTMSIKKKCCRHAFNDGCGIYSAKGSPASLVQKGAAGVVCNDCMSHFIAGLFVASGNISDPNKSYHMEFSFADDSTADAVSEVLSNAGFELRRGRRKGRALLYYKNSADIEDLLGYMGASSGVFELINAKIVKEIRENTNRQVNCDSANIAKTIGAAEKHIRIIEELKENECFNALTGELKETAEIRVKYPNASIAELGQYFIPPISKSGVKHRLDKLLSYYESEKLKGNIK